MKQAKICMAFKTNMLVQKSCTVFQFNSPLIPSSIPIHHLHGIFMILYFEHVSFTYFKGARNICFWYLYGKPFNLLMKVWTMPKKCIMCVYTKQYLYKKPSAWESLNCKNFPHSPPFHKISSIPLSTSNSKIPYRVGCNLHALNPISF